MPRDMILGLAVGIAVVGIVAALFFRRDPAVHDVPPPPLPGADELDREISEKPKAPYINGLSEFVDAPAAPAVDVASPRPKAKPDAYQLPGFLAKDDTAEHRAFLNGKPPAAPDPIAEHPGGVSVAHNRTHVPQPAPAHNRDWQVEGPGSTKPGSPSRVEHHTASSGSQRTHVVHDGDTLSSLASRYLGSSSRFHEIYEANRNVLRNPNDLRDGMTLVIPEAGKGQRLPGADPTLPSISGKNLDRNALPARPDRHSEPALSGDAQPGKLRFAPVPRGALTVGRTSGDAAPTPPSRNTPSRDERPSRPRIELDDRDPFD
ncbi:MAG: LysM peptidoglycan-binding domain-containing protein [Planctomycetaceae bacterium]|nr:LysM peptidoglycan-binding domain-containing protein [Planctomycetaceae bacterium]